MRQKFFTNTIQGKFIKNLLLNTSLPLYNSCRDGDYLVSNTTYIYNNYIIKCIQSGILGEDAQVKILRDDFVFGKTYVGNTKIFESSSNFYDSDTHRYLGEYLRFYRDIFKTDLMPFYNCFDGVYTSKFYIDTLKNIVKQSNYDYYQQGSDTFNNRYYTKENFKVVMIPIKFNKNYTIAIDCSAQVILAPCFVNHGQLIEVEYGGNKLNLTTEFNSLVSSIYKINSLVFNTPTLINIPNREKQIIEGTSLPAEEFFQRYENYLYLLIQLPVTNTSSIVILEGDYTDLTCNKFFSVDEIDDISDEVLDTLCLSNLSLLNFNDNLRYPYSDRLIEYLLWNVIDNNEDIGNNVLLIQQKTGVNLVSHPSGYYDKYTRAYIYNLYKNSKRYTDNDNNGYVDKSVEAFLFK